MHRTSSGQPEAFRVQQSSVFPRSLHTHEGAAGSATLEVSQAEVHISGTSRAMQASARPVPHGNKQPGAQGNLKKPEVLAPAGGWPQLRAAVENGADAVYFGLSAFSARARATNFTPDELPEVCHLRIVSLFGLQCCTADIMHACPHASHMRDACWCQIAPE